MKFIRFLVHCKPLFYFLQWTWGIIMNLIGLFGALAMLISGHKPHLHHGCIYFQVGRCWGGVNFGMFFFTDSYAYKQTLDHETGHAIQNILWGPLMPFVIAIPSACRYWHREHLVRSGKKTWEELPDYDSIWFEGQASCWGATLYN